MMFNYTYSGILVNILFVAPLGRARPDRWRRQQCHGGVDLR
jgi:hypothetical protein